LLRLRGDGRLVVLSAATVRVAFLRLVVAGRLTYRDLRAFEALDLGPPPSPVPLLDRLYRRVADAALTRREVAAIERQINRMVVGQGLALLAGEGRIEVGYTPGRGAGLSLRRGPYVIRHGLFFDLEPLRRADLLAGGPRDIARELEPDRSVQIVRYLGLQVDPRRGELRLHFAHRPDMSRMWSEPLAALAASCRRLFTLRRVAAGPGFQLDGLSPLLQGR
jgi:hypothetical protein